jgi:hypothetical protein
MCKKAAQSAKLNCDFSKQLKTDKQLFSSKLNLFIIIVVQNESLSKQVD